MAAAAGSDNDLDCGAVVLHARTDIDRPKQSRNIARSAALGQCSAASASVGLSRHLPRRARVLYTGFHHIEPP